jgi:hypothetical protein
LRCVSVKGYCNVLADCYALRATFSAGSRKTATREIQRREAARREGLAHYCKVRATSTLE